ncbi:FtsX-like permease family protein [Devosia neptuniae]|jgi:lipoprotein-releasing system permease protein|uniref:ABC transporter permease n=1 Tax=Devosia TaxID=46913 RepID=UPI0022AEC656|nr:FtsX-like permease family protein [Devosia neptuniae]MCZ4346840.1 ABC transporter permease [Devosia neptuniae]|tara:strand:- start:117978 stop:119183 length:1206 start_codon:yes stop_codon:yes gene_type:complete
MLYGLKIAMRYLTASKAQTGLLIAGVAVGVFVFIFMSALIGGLAVYLVQRTVGDIAHVTVQAPSRDAVSLLPDSAGVLVVQQRVTNQREQLRTADAFVPVIEALPGVAVTSQQIVGNGFLVRGMVTAPVGVTGVEIGKVSAIANIEKALVDGSTDLSNSTVIIGKTLAHDLGIGVGQVARLQSDRGVDRALVVGGIFELGLDALDSRAAFVNLATARTLFELPQGISRIEIKLDDLDQADAFAARIAAETGLQATSWTEGNAQLLSGLQAQGSSGTLIKAFALITIVIGVASALLLSTYRRRPEIGIMRAMGASRGFVIFVFVTQGSLIGILGGLIGAGLGYAALSPFPVPELAPPGGLPVDVRQGAYGLAIGLTALGAILASILPARSAARVDPVSVIGQ